MSLHFLRPKSKQAMTCLNVREVLIDMALKYFDIHFRCFIYPYFYFQIPIDLILMILHKKYLTKYLTFSRLILKKAGRELFSPCVFQFGYSI